VTGAAVRVVGAAGSVRDAEGGTVGAVGATGVVAGRLGDGSATRAAAAGAAATVPFDACGIVPA
jgi:hypothetical protein